MALVVVIDPHSDGVLVSDNEYRETVECLDMYRSKFEDLLRTVMLAYKDAARGCHGDVENLRSIERWIQDNYIDFREYLPQDLKRLYLQEIAFPPR